MGEDRKLQKRKKKRREPESSSSYSDSESSDSETDKRKSKDRRKEKERSGKRIDDGRRKDRRKEEKSKKKKEKRRHHSTEEDSERSDTDEEEKKKKRKLLKEAKRILKEHKKEATNSTRKLTRQTLTEDDYFEKNKEFSTWLKEERGVYFSSLSADESRRIFLDFIEAWNSGKISAKLYSGIDNAARTDHKWKIRHEVENAADKEEELEFMKKLEKIQRKKFRKENEDLMDELLPKATGRERLLEKKAIRREGARNREDSPEIFKERDIMGGGDDFKQRLERERARREKKASEKSGALVEKQLAFDQKESAAMNHLKSLVDIAGGKITIPKRMN